jgi:hypothetical protein
MLFLRLASVPILHQKAMSRMFDAATAHAHYMARPSGEIAGTLIALSSHSPSRPLSPTSYHYSRIVSRTGAQLDALSEHHVREADGRMIVMEAITRRPELKDYGSVPYPRLNSPAEQIRLVEIQESDVSTEIVTIAIKVWDLNVVPPYRCVSYTWGKHVFEDIIIDKQRCRVRRNCYYALWQIREQHFPGPIWIDSLCIDQENLSEKAVQIQLMATIYTHASLLFACVGAHADLTEVLIETVQQKKSAEFAALYSPLSENEQEMEAGMELSEMQLWDVWLEGLDEQSLNSLRTALKNFVSRPYWSRVWVVQEIALSEGKILILCGTDAIVWDDLELILQLVGEGKANAFDDAGAPKRLWDDFDAIPLAIEVGFLNILNGAHSESLDTMIRRTVMSLCSDPRDHIYGILSLVEWSREPIRPDYTRSHFDLAMEVLPHLHDISTLYEILQLLGIRHDQPEMKRLLQSSRNNPDDDDDVENRTGEFEAQQVEFDGVYVDTFLCLTLLAAGNGQLIAALRNEDPQTWSTKTQEIMEALDRGCARWTAEGHNDTPCLVRDRGGTVAMMCGAAQPGDIVIRIMSPWRHNHTVLILQKNEGDEYDIISQGFLMPGYEIPDIFAPYFEDSPRFDTLDEAEIRSIFRAEVNLTMTVGDAMRLSGQDCVGADRQLSGYDPDARVQRLWCKAVTYPKRAARLKIRQR